MHKYYRNALVAVSFAVIVGCQVPNSEGFFKLQPRDTVITTAVLEAMLQNEDLSSLKVHVETDKGVVMLSGYVKTIRQSDPAEELAKKTAGVKSVKNEIIVRK